jgi:hypothetical protein
MTRFPSLRLSLRLRSASRILAVAVVLLHSSTVNTITDTIKDTHTFSTSTVTPSAPPPSTTALPSLLTSPSTSSLLPVRDTPASHQPLHSTSSFPIATIWTLEAPPSTSIVSTGLDEDEEGSAVAVAAEGGEDS